MKRNRQQRTCHCAAYAFPHRHDVRRCIVEDEDDALCGDDYAADHRADDPRRGLAKELNRLIRRVGDE